MVGLLSAYYQISPMACWNALDASQDAFNFDPLGRRRQQR
jgi:hypothetical protein